MKTEDMTIEELARTVFHMHGHLIKKEFETRDITRVSHPHMLFMLRFRSKNSQGLSQKDIADRLGVSTPTVAISVKRMEKSGLLCKIPDEHDHRYNLIVLRKKDVGSLMKQLKLSIALIRKFSMISRLRISLSSRGCLFISCVIWKNRGYDLLSNLGQTTDLF